MRERVNVARSVRASFHCHSRQKPRPLGVFSRPLHFFYPYFPCCCLLSFWCWGVIGWCLAAWLCIRNSSVVELLYEHYHCSLLSSGHHSDFMKNNSKAIFISLGHLHGTFKALAVNFTATNYPHSFNFKNCPFLESGCDDGHLAPLVILYRMSI